MGGGKGDRRREVGQEKRGIGEVEEMGIGVER